MVSTKPHLHTVADSDGAAILDIEQGLITTLNATGAYVWQCLERGDTVPTVIRNLVRETGESPELLEADVRQFVADLTANHLLSK